MAIGQQTKVPKAILKDAVGATITHYNETTVSVGHDGTRDSSIEVYPGHSLGISQKYYSTSHNWEEGGWQLGHSTIEQTGPPRRLDM